MKAAGSSAMRQTRIDTVRDVQLASNQLRADYWICKLLKLMTIGQTRFCFRKRLLLRSLTNDQAR
jgi:hypothetical protein